MGRTRESANLVSDNNIFVSISNDRVGIGTTAPAGSLDVAGNVLVNGSEVINSSGVWQGSSAGIQGIQGIQGTQGTTGTQGTQGTQGTTGTQGIQGIQGIQGAAGVLGGDGADGAQGTQGTTGTQGTDGSNGSAGSQGIQGITGALNAWSRKTGTYTASNGDRLIADTSGGVFTITLPASPSTGHAVEFADGASWATNNLTIARNGSTIEGAAENLTVDVAGVSIELIYDGSTWEVFTSAGPQGTAGSTGAQGTQGTQGTTGTQGIQGKNSVGLAILAYLSPG